MVLAGAMVGAPLRYWIDRFVQSHHGSAFPWGTLSVNVAGSLILGTLTGALVAGATGDGLRLLVGTGLCGALTTYSTFSYETLQLTRSGARFYALANLAVTPVAGLGAYHGGIVVAHLIWV